MHNKTLGVCRIIETKTIRNFLKEKMVSVKCGPDNQEDEEKVFNGFDN